MFFLLQISLDNYDKDFVSIENQIDQIRHMVEQRYLDFVRLIDTEKNTILIKIEDHIRSTTST